MLVLFKFISCLSHVTVTVIPCRRLKSHTVASCDAGLAVSCALVEWKGSSCMSIGRDWGNLVSPAVFVKEVIRTRLVPPCLCTEGPYRLVAPSIYCNVVSVFTVERHEYPKNKCTSHEISDSALNLWFAGFGETGPGCFKVTNMLLVTGLFLKVNILRCAGTCRILRVLLLEMVW